MRSDVKTYQEITKDSYQVTAAEYATNVLELAPLASIKHFMGMLPPNPHIIDIGCGSGRDAKIFTSMEAKVVGIDFCPNLIEIAKAHAPLADFHLMNIETMAVTPSFFDGAWAACSLAHLSKASFPAVLKDIYTMLKNKGYFYLALKQGEGEGLEIDKRYEGHVEKFWAYYEYEELKNFLEEAQFKVIQLDVIEKSYDYQSHAALRAFCQKS
jgi:SAM-dependent methyltransferase